MNYLPRMLQKLKKMRYFRNFCFLLSKNLRLAQNLPNEVFVYKSDFKVDIPYTETLRISLGSAGRINKMVRKSNRFLIFFVRCLMQVPSK